MRGACGLFCVCLIAACSSDGLSSVPPSCDKLPPSCGPTGTSSCCESQPVPGGAFYRSYDAAGDGGHADEAFPASVSPFRLDAYEVTVGRFRKFVEAGQGTQSSPPSAGAGAQPKVSGSGWDASWDASLVADTAALTAGLKCLADYQTWTDAPSGNEDRPINCITWYEAAAFCAWDGGFLPTEAQWNFAASGGAEQRAYPWSNPPGSLAIDCGDANYDAGSSLCTGSLDRVGARSPAGDGKWGQADLGGNLFEWTLDGSNGEWPGYAQAACDDCAFLAVNATNRIVRGGSFISVAAELRTAVRFTSTSAERGWQIGVRCARSP